MSNKIGVQLQLLRPGTSFCGTTAVPILGPSLQPFYGVWEDKEKKAYVIHNGERRGPYDELGYMTLVGDTPLYAARRGQEWFIVHGEQEGTPYKEVSSQYSNRMRSDSGRFLVLGGKPLYRGSDNNEQHYIVWGENRRGPYPAPWGSPDAHLPFALGGEPFYVVRQSNYPGEKSERLHGWSGYQGPPCRGVAPSFGSVLLVDGKPLYAADMNEAEEYLVWGSEVLGSFINPFYLRNGTSSPLRTILNLTRDKGGDRPLYRFHRRDKVFVVWGEEERGPYSMVLSTRLRIVDGKPLYAVERDKKQFVVWGNEEGPDYQEVEVGLDQDLAIFEGRPLYAAKRFDGKRVLVWGNKETIFPKGASLPESDVHGLDGKPIHILSTREREKRLVWGDWVGDACEEIGSRDPDCSLTMRKPWATFVGGMPLYFAKIDDRSSEADWSVIWGPNSVGPFKRYPDSILSTHGKPLYEASEAPRHPGDQDTQVVVWGIERSDRYKRIYGLGVVEDRIVFGAMKADGTACIVKREIRD